MLCKTGVDNVDTQLHVEWRGRSNHSIDHIKECVTITLSLSLSLSLSLLQSRFNDFIPTNERGDIRAVCGTSPR